MGWVSPTSHNDPQSAWTNPTQCYDDDAGTMGFDAAIPAESYGEYLELIRASISCDKIRYNALFQSAQHGIIDVDVYYDSDWHDVYEGSFTHSEWVEKSIPAGTKSVTKARVRFYNDHATTAYYGGMRDFDFNEIVIVAPTVTTQAVSSIATTTATGNGNITATGGQDASAWGTCLATTANPDTGDTVDAGSGSGGTGAFTTSMDGLVSPAKYHVRAYATNSAGTSYGADVTFITLMTASVIVGNLVTASRAVTATRSASVIVGNLVSATKSRGRAISASVAVGVVASASKSFGVVKSALVIVGVVATASRVAGITRTASTIIGIVPSASRLIATIRTAATPIGVVASASRSVTYTRASSVIIGVIATAKSFWAYIKLSLKKRVVNFTLPDRTTDFTLPKRITDFTLRDREE